MGCFHDQIMPRAIRSEGHPWLQRPSGSTMQPSVQQAGDVPSNIAWRAYSKAPSSEGSQPSFSSASMALIRYGLRVAVGTCVVFICFAWASIARAALACHARADRGIHATDSMKCRFPVPCTGMWIERTPERAPAQARHSEHGVPERSLAHSVSTV